MSPLISFDLSFREPNSLQPVQSEAIQVIIGLDGLRNDIKVLAIQQIAVIMLAVVIMFNSYNYFSFKMSFSKILECFWGRA
jgi:hypothetical protein